jgi:hypothetical protein
MSLDSVYESMKVELKPDERKAYEELILTGNLNQALK